MARIAKGNRPRGLRRALRRVVRYAEHLGIEVSFHELERSYGEFVPSEMQIYVDSKQTLRDQMNYLLHELGHADIHLEGLTRDRYNVFDDDAKTPRERLTLVEEEFEAWHRGRLIARRLGIVLDESYEIVRENALMTYVRWCATNAATLGATPVGSKV